MSKRDLLDEVQWSHYQRDIFDAVVETDEHLVIQAVAGSGKTSTIIEAGRRYVEARKPGSKSVAFLAFNAHIAEELRRRIHKKIDARTLHSLGNGGIRFSRPGIVQEVLEDKSFGILQELLPVEGGRGRSAEVKQQDRLRRLIHSQAARVVSIAKNTMMPIRGDSIGVMNGLYNAGVHPPDEKDELWEPEPKDRRRVPERSDPRLWCWVHFVVAPVAYQVYEQSSEVLETIDYDDMIWLPVVLPGIKVKHYKVAFVDECQDLNETQHRLIHKMVDRGTRIIAVGDPSQSIYLFRGAKSDSMGRLKTKLGARELPLSVCYRCPQKHVRLAKTLVPRIESPEGAPEGRIEFRLWDLAMKDLRDGDHVISRMNAPLLRGAFQLLRGGRKAVVIGRDIGKNLKSLVEKLENSVKRNAESLGEMKSQARAKWPESYKQLREAMVDSPAGIQPLLVANHHRLWTELDKLAGEVNPSEASRDKLHDDHDAVLALAENAISPQEVIDRIDEVFSDSAVGVVFSTIHRFKGGEGSRVVLMGGRSMPLGWARTEEQYQQELNCLYVALTRAKHDLVITFTKKEAEAHGKEKYDPEIGEPITQSVYPQWLSTAVRDGIVTLDMDDFAKTTDGGSPLLKALDEQKREIQNAQEDQEGLVAAAQAAAAQSDTTPDGLFGDGPPDLESLPPAMADVVRDLDEPSVYPPLRLIRDDEVEPDTQPTREKKGTAAASSRKAATQTAKRTKPKKKRKRKTSPKASAKPTTDEETDDLDDLFPDLPPRPHRRRLYGRDLSQANDDDDDLFS